MIHEIEDTKKAEALFEGWEETMIRSCIQGIMGHIYAPAMEGGQAPRSAMALLGDFCFFAGEPSEELVRFSPQNLGKEKVKEGQLMYASIE